MGANQSTPVGIGAHSTAKEVRDVLASSHWKMLIAVALQVIEAFGSGEYLAGKTAVVTGGNSGIG
jgi:hypothetical protein